MGIFQKMDCFFANCIKMFRFRKHKSTAKIALCKCVSDSGADYIKTSTGFSTGGATFADVELFAKNIGKNVKIKAAGGISSLEDAEKFVSLGASRLGTSRVVKIVKAMEAGG